MGFHKKEKDQNKTMTKKQNEHGSRYTLHEMSVFFRFIAKNQLESRAGGHEVA